LWIGRVPQPLDRGRLAGAGWHRALETDAKFAFAAAVAITAVGALLFAPAQHGYYLADDFAWVRDFSSFQWSQTTDLFAGRWAGPLTQEYRPLWALSFVLDLRIWGANPVALHLSNLIFHTLASLLVWRVAATTVGGGRGAGLLALAFFVVAPVHEEAVAWISARGHVLVTIFALAALLLLGRFEARGGLACYLGSIFATVAAFATQELAVAVPPLLLLRDLLAPRRARAARLVRLHAPFWLLLAGYLGLRVAVFGTLTRDDAAPSVRQIVPKLYASASAAWLSPTLLAGIPQAAAFALLLLAVGLIAAPLMLTCGGRLRQTDGAYVRGALYFGLIWPLLAVAPLLGASQQRHLYFASAGIAVALGLAGARILNVTSLVGRVLAGALGVVLLVHALLLVSGVAAMARNGRLSGQIREQLVAAVQRSTPDDGSAIVVLPEVPDSQRHLWEYALPVAAEPLFVGQPHPANVIGSFTSCYCNPQEWLTENARALDRLADGSTRRVYVIEWDASAAAFTTRVLDRARFWAVYASPGGPFLRARRPGLPTPVLPPPQA
jgi:hypothetical protein